MNPLPEVAQACKKANGSKACGANFLLANTDACSVITCEACMKASGEATPFCVVCRRTTRGQERLFPGKEGTDHAQCPGLMRQHATDPSAIGAYDLCTCPEAAAGR
jgi:hypothetical protein